MIAPNMATMLAFVATDAPVGRAAARRARGKHRRRVVQSRRRSTAIRRPTTASCSWPPARRRWRRSFDADDPRLRPVARCARARRRRARAGDRARRRGRDQVHHHSSSTADATTANADRVARAIAAFAARQDSVLRLRSQSGPNRLRDRQRGDRAISIRRCVSFWLDDVLVVADGGRAASLSRGGRPARDEAGRDRAFASHSARRRDGDGVDLRSVARLRHDQRRLPELTRRREPNAITGPSADRARRRPACAASKRCCRRAGAGPDWKARPRFAGASAAARATCSRSSHPHAIRARRPGRDRRAEARRSTRNTRQFVAGLAGEQRAAHRLARHRQVVAGEGDARQVRGEGPAPDRSRQGRPGRPARHRRAGRRRGPSAFIVFCDDLIVRRRRARLQGARR